MEKTADLESNECIPAAQGFGFGALVIDVKGRGVIDDSTHNTGATGMVV
jgi:hypothetical protein